MPLWKKVTFGLATVFLFFGVAELLCWAAGVPTLLAERDPFLGFSRRMPVFRLDETAGVYRTLDRAARHSFNAQTFTASKPDDGLRIFVIGGSSAYGFPWSAETAFSSHLEKALRADGRATSVEVINAAAMSYGSHRLRILVHELLRYQPDALVVYAGHNEFVERRFYRDHAVRPDGLEGLRGLLSGSHFYSLLTRLYERTVDTDAERPATTGDATTGELLGLDVVRELPNRVLAAERETVRDQFDENLRAIVEAAHRAGVEVILCTVPSNVRDWVPNQSSFGPGIDGTTRDRVTALLKEGRETLARGDAAAATAALEQAAELAPAHAEVSFQLGRAYEALGRVQQARVAYVRARDEDRQPARAISELNEVIRRVGRESEAVVVDIERAFEEASGDGLLGFNLFEDYVHPKPGGHKLIAFEVWKRLREGAPQAEFWSAIGGTPESVIGADPEAPAAAAGAKTASQLFNLAIVLGNQGRVDRAIEKYRECIELDPTHVMARSNLGRLLVDRGSMKEAEAVLREALLIKPGHLQALLGLGETLRRMNRWDEAEATFERAVAVDAGSVDAWRALATVYRQRQAWDPAVEAYRNAARLDPTEPEIHAELGVVLLSTQKTTEAEEAFRDCVELDAENVVALNGLAAILVYRGRLDEGRRGFEKVLRLDPGNRYARQSLQALSRHRAPTD